LRRRDRTEMPGLSSGETTGRATSGRWRLSCTPYARRFFSSIESDARSGTVTLTQRGCDEPSTAHAFLIVTTGDPRAPDHQATPLEAADHCEPRNKPALAAGLRALIKEAYEDLKPIGHAPFEITDLEPARKAERE